MMTLKKTTATQMKNSMLAITRTMSRITYGFTCGTTSAVNEYASQTNLLGRFNLSFPFLSTVRVYEYKYVSI